MVFGGSDVSIRIGTEFVGKKGLTQADKQLKAFTKNVRNLAGALGIGLATSQIIRFGKESLSAFQADQKAASALAITMKNLGLQFSNPNVENYISNLSKLAGIADDQLRPAMQALLQVTGSVTKSQKILSQAVDVSRATNVDLLTVSEDLAQVFVGNTRGLRKYNLGLTQAELKAASFADVQARLNTLFSGSSTAYLETYSGQMERLSVAAGEAKETIGKGLVDAFAALGGGGNDGLNRVISGMEYLSELAARLFKGLGGQVGAVGKLLTGDVRGAAALLASSTNPESYKGAIPSISSMVQASEQAKAEKAAIARAKELAKATSSTTKDKQKQLMLEKAKLALTKAAANFDITKINLAAALKGKVSEEDRKRLLALQAIENDNGELALKYISELDFARKQAAEAEEARLKALADAEMKRQNALLAAVQARIDAIQSMIDKVQRKIEANAAQALADVMASNAAASSGVAGYSGVGSGAYDVVTNPFAGTYYGETGRDPMPVSVNISLDGQVFQNAVVGAVNSASSSGTQLSYTQTAIRS